MTRLFFCVLLSVATAHGATIDLGDVAADDVTFQNVTENNWLPTEYTPRAITAEFGVATTTRGIEISGGWHLEGKYHTETPNGEERSSLAMTMEGHEITGVFIDFATDGRLRGTRTLDASMSWAANDSAGSHRQVFSIPGGTSAAQTFATYVPTATADAIDLTIDMLLAAPYQSVIGVKNITIIADLLPDPLPGDANGDRRTDAEDLNLLALNWKQHTATGDLTGDSFVDANDLNELALNWNVDAKYPRLPAAAMSAAVPEPAGLVLMWLCLLRLSSSFRRSIPASRSSC
jgi:hypothetical protein